MAALILGLFLSGSLPALAAPQRIVSVFLCTDEYVFRLVPRDRIAALSVLAGDTHPVVSTIADKVKGIALVRPSAEAVLARHPDLVVLYKGTNPRLSVSSGRGRRRCARRPLGQFAGRCAPDHPMLGQRFGTPIARRALLAAMDARLAAARARAPSPPVSALIYEPNGYVTADAVSEADHGRGRPRERRRIADGRRGWAASRSRRWWPPRPQLLILNASREGGPSLADAALRHPALAALKGRSLIVRSLADPLLCPGPWSADVAGEFADLAQQSRPPCEGPGRALRLASRRCPADGRGEKGTRCGHFRDVEGAYSAAAPATVSGEWRPQMPLGNREGGVARQSRKPGNLPNAASSIR